MAEFLIAIAVSLLMFTLRVSEGLKYSSNKVIRAVTTRLSPKNVVADSGVGMKYNNIILFDGVCSFCNRWVDLLMTLDGKKKFKLCALQSEKGKELLAMVGRDSEDISSIVLIRSAEKREVYLKSAAVLKIAEQLGLPFYIFSVLGSTVLPLSFSNRLYDQVAANRYNFLGKRETCRLPDESNLDRFI